MNPLCIYHAQCADGFGAAWAVRHALGDGNVDFHPGVYGNPPPDVAGRHVILVDFSYKRPVLDEMVKSACSILILDHHKTAAADLADLIEAPLFFSYRDMIRRPTSFGVFGHFDMERSGAGLAWDYFHPGQPRPALIDHLEDRDLWRFEKEPWKTLRPNTRTIQATVFSHPYDFAVRDQLMTADLDAMALEGHAIERKHFKDIDELLGVVTRKFKIKAPNPDGAGGVTDLPIELANLPYTLTSDAGHKLATRSPHGIGGCYWDTPEGRVFSLRATETGLDVSAIAKIYGGGGHRAAAGFRVAFNEINQFEV